MARRARPTEAMTGAELKVIEHYIEWVDLTSVLPINVHLSSASEQTMISLLGSPKLPLTPNDQPERASDMVKAMKQTRRLAPHLVATAISPALDSLAAILAKVFEAEPGLRGALSDSGMLNVRYRRPTDGRKSTAISNHAWGTAIDFRAVGQIAPANTGHRIPRYVAILLPFMNAGGWYSGIGFHDTMHFEVAEETIRDWARKGLLKS